ncbi:hypothetical protein BVC80_7231g2 [Macleaya cordata]|uniref:Uncharacterized protein n=1 Tax=Macleaya cordata TaxID=56857 RepID=A0A200PYM3_MACCD|nr:hypothetical protein BVC80_7231g2 [Macleaya cordata]
MVKVKPYEDDCCLMKYIAASEQSKCRRLQLQGVKIPLYKFGNQSSLDNYVGLSCTHEEDQSLLDTLLLAQWEDRAWKGLLGYDVTTCEIKVICARRKFVCQLNEGWNMDYFPKPKEEKVFQQSELSVYCMNILREELLFSVSNGEKAIPELIHSATVPNDANLIFVINANPVEYGHVFLVPRGFYGLPQSMDARVLEMVTRVAVEINNCSLRIFYDFSASIANHLYFQACYFANPLPVELMPVVNVLGNWQEKGIHISEVADYPIKALTFEGNGNLKLLVEVVAEICSCLQNQDIRYCLLISSCGKKMFLFPQLHMLATTCTLSAWECGGHFVFKERNDFDRATEDILMKRMAAVSLTDEAFEAVKQLSCSVAGKLAS